MSRTYRTVGEALVGQMTHLGLNVRDAAHRADVYESQISNWRGGAAIGPANRAKLVNAGILTPSMGHLPHEVAA